MDMEGELSCSNMSARCGHMAGTRHWDSPHPTLGKAAFLSLLKASCRCHLGSGSVQHKRQGQACNPSMDAAGLLLGPLINAHTKGSLLVSSPYLLSLDSANDTLIMKLKR